jgi:uncharacterized membrane protein
MRLLKAFVGKENRDHQKAIKPSHPPLNSPGSGFIETYIIYKIQLPGRGKIMKALCGLFTVLLLLGPIGMGILVAVDSPNLDGDTSISDHTAYVPEDHGTRAIPPEVPTDVMIYFRNGNIMNTTSVSGNGPNFGVLTISFSLQDPLINELLVGEITVIAHLSGAGSVDVTVRDGSGGTVVGEASYGPFSLGNIPQAQTIAIPFSSGSDYTFPAGNQIVVEFDFGTSGGRLHYHTTQSPSRIILDCTPISDITINTFNFFNEASELFYPNNIMFPEDTPRRQVRAKGIITEVFGKSGSWQYVNNIEVVIEGEGTNITRSCDYDKDIFEYSYTWNYPSGQKDGEYTITTHVFDEQGNEFTAFNFFNMSNYGVLLTSPSQVPEEGTYKSEARQNLVQSSITTYDITVWNIGKNATGVDLSTNGFGGWDWWLDGESITDYDNITKTGSIPSIEPGSSADFYLAVDSLSNPIGAQAVVLLTAQSQGDSARDHTLTTKSLVVLQYDVELDFSDGKKTAEKRIETGDSIKYDFVVTNGGGEDDTIFLDVSSAPAGWTISLEGDDLQGSAIQYRVELGSSASADISLLIETESDRDEETVEIEITGISQGSQDQGDDPAISDKIKATTTTTMGIMLELDDIEEKDTDPDERVSFRFRLTNTGTHLANMTVTFSGISSSDGWNDNDVSFESGFDEDEKQYSNLAPSGSETFELYLTPSIEVYAQNYTILVKAARNDEPAVRFEDQTVFCIVNELYNIELSDPDPLLPELTGKAEPGEDVTYSVTIENNGNKEERISVVTDKPKDWGLVLGNGSGEWSETIEPGDSETITIVFTVPKDASGDETVTITISIIPSNSDTILVNTETEIEQTWWAPIMILIVPLGLFLVMIFVVYLIYKRR